MVRNIPHVTNEIRDATTFHAFSTLLGTDACAVPVLTPKEAGKQTSNIPVTHPQVSDQVQNAGKQPVSKGMVIKSGTHTAEVLQEYGYDAAHVRQLFDEGVVGGETLPTTSKL
jgi:alpha-methylacyl-CoA racemase